MDLSWIMPLLVTVSALVILLLAILTLFKAFYRKIDQGPFRNAQGLLYRGYGAARCSPFRNHEGVGDHPGAQSYRERGADLPR